MFQRLFGSVAPARRPLFAWLLASAACLALAACGGGSAGTAAPPPPPPPQPTVSISAAPMAVLAGQALTLTWNAQNTGTATCEASGAWSGQVVASGTRTITPAAPGSAIFTLTCGAASGSVTVPVAAPSTSSNTVAVSVDAGPSGVAGSINVPFVSVTVCRPGTAVCQTVDHVMLDTGSYGLRLMAPLDAALALPAVAASAGGVVGECAQFVDGYTWGSVVQADVRLAGEVAPAQSIQLIGAAPGGVATVPATCTGVGRSLGTVAALGANGVLGIGLFRQDCGSACVNDAIPATYYACAGSACSPSDMPLARQVSNPVAAFAADNNGVVLSLPSVAANGVTALAGTLTFGIGTQMDNTIAAETRYAVDGRGNFTTVYKGRSMTASFLDSGSNGLYFDDASLPVCRSSTGFYCPASPLALTAINQGYDGVASGTVNFTLNNVDTLGGDIVAVSVGGTNGSQRSSGTNAFDWGLPFFFGRRIFVGFEGGPGGGYWAY